MTILFQAKFLILAILFFSISSLVKSETPSHCSELYGCQTEDPQEKIVNKNLSSQLKKDFHRHFKNCKDNYRMNKLTFLPKSGLWIESDINHLRTYYEVIDLDLSQVKRSELGMGRFNNYYLCPYEFSEYVRTGKEPNYDNSDNIKINKYKSNYSNENDNIFNTLVNNTFICADTGGPRIEFKIPGGEFIKTSFRFPIKIFKKDRKSFELRQAKGSFYNNVFKGHYYLDSNHISGDPKVVYGDNREDWYKVKFTYRSDTNQFMAMISKLTAVIFSCVKK